MLADGAFGRPYYVEADYLSHNGSWWFGLERRKNTGPRRQRLLVGGCHAIDALRWFAAPGEFEAATPVEVFAVAGGYRQGEPAGTTTHNLNAWVDGPRRPWSTTALEVALVKFDNGACGKVSVNADCIMPYRFPLRIFGDLGLGVR